MMIAVLGGVVVVVGATLLYLASPNQRLAKARLPGRLLAWTGIAALASVLALVLRWAGPVASVFIVVTLAMVAWTVLPLIVAWWRGAPEGKS